MKLTNVLRSIIAALLLVGPVITSAQSAGVGYTTASAGLRVRVAPAGDATGALLPLNSRVEIAEARPDGWLRIESYTRDGVRLGAPAWISGTFVSFSPLATPTPFVPTPTPTPTAAPRSDFRLGLHVINDHRSAQSAVDAGARFIVWMDGKVGAVNFARANPSVIVAYRKYVGQARLSADDWIRALEVGPNDPLNLVYTAFNESDSIGTSPNEIRERGKVDTELARKLRAINPGYLLLAGSFAHGNPDVTDPAVCAAMREAYAPGYNAGLFDFDLHNYTRGRRFASHPPANAAIIDPIWFELRALQLIDCAGFVRRRGFWSTETGVEAGAGGFAWAGYTEQQYYEWCRWALAAGSESGLFNGWAIFQHGEHAGWRGYDVRGNVNGYTRALRDGPMVLRDVGPYAPPPAYETPARKVMR